ncbi:LacI family DNA-binding transcriptional regulator [Proteiniborus sp. MB09-C3]|uniref:LacI family DNA-binding transcriptional regulator n=1 Tax=Proteiniborus sp. MB09-C3 TaxID=3050072 RepID=UPI002552C366|nr:LacI family DNA-binding transcriptional regulator [Proteiniborus sp. MB09-C3]WIV12229.1 LacI family DNA-binding transcriptional regulator [Proteiniborus sp. MB09-C3]
MGINRIARMAGVSTATVSKILNGKDQAISESTRQRVLEIVEREGYIPNAIAKSLKINNTKTIGLIIPDVMNLFFSELAKGVEDSADKRGYSLILCNTDNSTDKEKKYLQVLQSKRVDGIIITAVENSSDTSFENCIAPIVLLDRDIKTNRPVGRIKIDNEKCTYDAVTFLLNKGCTNIGFISSDTVNSLSRSRLEGYMSALKENDIPYDEKIVYLKDYSVEAGYAGALKLIENSEVDGICCGNDLIAIGAIKALKEKNIDIPKDVKIIGLDDIFISSYFNPPITTVKQPIYDMGLEAVNLLIDMIEKRETDLLRVFNHKIIERMST